MRVPVSVTSAVATSLAACLICSVPTTPLAFAPYPLPALAVDAVEQPRAATSAPTDASSAASQEQRVQGSVNGARAVVATEAEVKALRSEAQSLTLPPVPADSDLGKLLSGEATLPSNGVQAPRECRAPRMQSLAWLLVADES